MAKQFEAASLSMTGMRQALDYYWPDMCEIEGCAGVMRWRVRCGNVVYYVCETHRGMPWFDVPRSAVDLLRPESQL